MFFLLEYMERYKPRNEYWSATNQMPTPNRYTYPSPNYNIYCFKLLKDITLYIV